ncbi:hypothetical protein HAX54_047842 [Datura stramonium]|uniref:Uncharacterized protein n=1 Tax=Datura stramonium TaxID=4076 RepID=A0ABS8WMG0_DATST|nr:hypothetical protein [Datura stramonium]
MPTPQGVGSSSTAPVPPCRATATAGALGWIFLLTHENFTNIIAKTKRADKLVNSLLSELPLYVNRAIENALKPMRDALVASQQIVTSKLYRLEARMTQLERSSNISEMPAADIGVSILSIMASPPTDPTPCDLDKMPRERGEETDEEALEEEDDPDIPLEEAAQIWEQRSSP